ncbi:MAG: hypothetical protein MK086_00900 [Flavobacteriales bacterium]|nr:hypothetical protein [Flavobacteriales bacterium]
MAQHIIIWGVILALSSFIISFGSWIIDSKVWAAHVGADAEHHNRRGAITTMMILLSVQIYILLQSMLIYSRDLQSIHFLKAAAIAYGIYQIFNLMDLLVFDYLIYMIGKPKFMRPDELPKADNFKKHFDDFINGLFFGCFPVMISVLIWYFIVR